MCITISWVCASLIYNPQMDAFGTQSNPFSFGPYICILDPLPRRLEPIDSEVSSTSIYQFGFPFVAFQYKWIITHPSDILDAYISGREFYGRILPRRTKSTSNRCLPLIPVWFGFTVNSLLFSIILLLISKIILLLRIKRCKKHGICFTCGYSQKGTTGNICSECGHNPCKRPYSTQRPLFYLVIALFIGLFLLSIYAFANRLTYPPCIRQYLIKIMTGFAYYFLRVLILT